MKNLAIVTLHYPTQKEPVYTFLEQLVVTFADRGMNCTVIVPTNHAQRMLRGQEKLPGREERSTPKGNTVVILRPPMFSVGGKPGLVMVTQKSFENAVEKAVRALPEKPDALYAHFLFPSGFAIGAIGQKMGIPAFVASGESSSALFKNVPAAYAKKCMAGVKGLIAVSMRNFEDLKDLGYFTDENAMRVFPNAADTTLFYPGNKQEARKKLQLPKDAFIAAFVGSFIKRKGIDVACEAFDSLQGVYSIFIGSGEMQPTCQNVLFKGRVPHEGIPEYLRAADIFVLPTTNEGCCNAIVEALACGLPVVSSDERFNDGLLDETNSLRVDERDAGAVASAVEKLKNDVSFREQLAKGAAEKGGTLEIGKRAEGILQFMRDRV